MNYKRQLNILSLSRDIDLTQMKQAVSIIRIVLLVSFVIANLH